jgi:hypothetical protein
MMRNLCWLLTSILLLALPAAATPPQRVEIAYQLTHNGSTVGEVLQRVEHDGRTYRIIEKWKGRGLLALRGSATRISRGLIVPQGLRPLEFTDERTGRDTARITFDWEARTAVMQYRGEPRQQPLSERAHDRLAMFFHFAFSSARDIEFDVMDGRGTSSHRYTVEGRERVTTPAGEFDAIRLSRTNHRYRADLWLAAEYSLLPLRVLIVQNDGTRIDQAATRLSEP